MDLGRRPSSIPTLPPQVGKVLDLIALEVLKTQEAASKMVGWSQASWSRMAAGERLLTEPELFCALRKLGLSRDEFDRRHASYSPQSATVGFIRWLVPPKRLNGEMLGVGDVLRLVGVAPDTLALPSYVPGPMRGASHVQGSALALRVRSAWGLGVHAPIADISLILGARAVLVIPADVVEPGAGRMKLRGAEREVIVVPERITTNDQRWAAARMFALLRRRGLSAAPETFSLDFAREFLLPQKAMWTLLRQFAKLPERQSVGAVATDLISQHFGAPREEVAKVVAAELGLLGIPDLAHVSGLPSGSNPWHTILRAADSGSKSGASGSK